MKIFLVAGARPNFMKIAPIVRALRSRQEVEKMGSYEVNDYNHNQINFKIVHTGQHYDYEMSQAFFDDLEIPKPDFFLEVGSGSHAEQTAKIMVNFEKVCEQERPDIVMVVGDVNSTLACSIVAKKLLIQVAHVEAGLRSFDLSMPEEINRMVTDSIADYFFVTEQSAIDNLKREGKPDERIYFVGHVMIDNLLYQLKKIEAMNPVGFKQQKLKQELDQYAFLTLHRPSNVDHYETLAGIVRALKQIAERTPIVFPVHPRTAKMLKHFELTLSDKISQMPPLGFQESLFLWKDARLVITDSGGLQEETTALGMPCLTLRENTERPITCDIGTNRLVGNEPQRIINGFEEVMNGRRKKGEVPPKWDGKAAERIVEVLVGIME